MTAKMEDSAWRVHLVMAFEMAVNQFTKLRQFAGCLALASCLIFASPLAAQNSELNAPLERVLFSEDDTIRGVVGEYLGDPDLWPTVLRINDIASPADVIPGMELLLPVRQVAAADRALAASLDAIQVANAEGARIFAPQEIGAAIENRDSALSQREFGEWRAVVDFSAIATSFAKQALDISIQQRDRSAEAIVSDVQGDVEGRAPAEPSWSGRDLNDILVEFERLRTLSNSTTQVTFRDLSRLRLNSNSNATIQRMRSDPLTGGEVTKVSLANGDFYALLNQLSDKTQFEIEVPGIESTTNSADFWIKNDRTGARFVNYDAEELEINRGGETIALGENEGVVVDSSDATVTQVLDSPLLQVPGLGDVIYTPVTQLNWDAYQDAQGYWLEIALDPGFNQMQVSEWGIRGTRFEAPLLPARYHWRVAALDALGLPGQWSTARDFFVRIDETPPFLTLLSPNDGTIVSVPRIDVLGATEPDAIIFLNGAPLELGRDGSFISTVALLPGPNTIAVEATDPAGNVSNRSQQIIYRPAETVTLKLDAKIPRLGEALATRTTELTVRGETNAAEGTPFVVRDTAGSAVVQALVETGGSIAFTVPAEPQAQTYRIEVLAPGGNVEGELAFAAISDQIPPKITLDVPPPRATGEDVLVLTGRADDASELLLDGTPVPLVNGRFDLSITLVPGANGFDLVASDETGNVSVTRLQTLLDIEPPEILSIDLRRPSGNGGPIELVVEASDASGLVQAAPFVIDIGGAEVDGFLRCDNATGICRASLPPEPGDLELIELILEDYAGNAAFE